MRSQTDRRPQQRSDLRREAILSALDAWLQSSTLDAVNIAEISKQAGVTRSAFYFYFENKGAAVAALMERMVDETFAVNELFTTGSEPPWVRVRTMLAGLVAMWERHRHLFKAMLEAVIDGHVDRALLPIENTTAELIARSAFQSRNRVILN